ncbi:complex I NDUFA9 subunit family protein [Acidithiobacillus sulfurivorans]|uniref:Complex I NDUFA9 subunit family protein n=1 Tax=Acidithiobacillus sulfurivorans TaxID=1958756 RepID=A0ABS5ZWZ5_9PROT|nr:complex I NDUFA9 subunit family protein [Acidithiobacillus sulfurivorans]MBU2759767.1 complex I NDUFA9 subunit family protein [Acidithiobacillus sulfurivorans]
MATHKICILGGTGFVGRHLAERLSQDGHQIRILTRNRERNRENLLVLPQVEVVECNVHEPIALEQQLKGRDVVINLVGILNENRPGRSDYPPERHGDFEKNHIELPRLVANLCGHLGIPRLLHMSALGANPIAPSAYLRSKGIGEEIIRQSGENSAKNGYFNYLNGPKLLWGRGLKVTSFRPSIIFGEGDSFFNRFAQLLRNIPFFLPMAGTEAKMQPVWIEDVVSAFVQSIDDEKTYGKAYDLCGPKVYTLGELIAYTQSLIGTHRKVIALCPLLGNLQAGLMEKLPGKVLTRDNLKSLSVDNISSKKDLQEVFNIQPTAIESIVPTYLGGKGQHTERLSAIRNRR